MIVKWDKETRRKIIGEIQEYFYREKCEEIGEIAAGDLLEFIDNRLAQFYFNEGINQAMDQWNQSVARLEEDLFSIKRPIG